jgi:hypothetical protein
MVTGVVGEAVFCGFLVFLTGYMGYRRLRNFLQMIEFIVVLRTGTAFRFYPWIFLGFELLRGGFFGVRRYCKIKMIDIPTECLNQLI